MPILVTSHSSNIMTQKHVVASPSSAPIKSSKSKRSSQSKRSKKSNKHRGQI